MFYFTSGCLENWFGSSHSRTNIRTLNVTLVHKVLLKISVSDIKPPTYLTWLHVDGHGRSFKATRRLHLRGESCPWVRGRAAWWALWVGLIVLVCRCYRSPVIHKHISAFWERISPKKVQVVVVFFRTFIFIRSGRDIQGGATAFTVVIDVCSRTGEGSCTVSCPKKCNKKRRRRRRNAERAAIFMWTCLLLAPWSSWLIAFWETLEIHSINGTLMGSWRSGVASSLKWNPDAVLFPPRRLSSGDRAWTRLKGLEDEWIFKLTPTKFAF